MDAIQELYEINDVSEIENENTEFVIDNDLKADWAIKIIKQEEDQAKRLIETIEQEIEILNAKKQKAKDAANCGFLKGKLVDYYDSLADDVKKSTKTQTSYKLPSGSLVFKHPVIEFVKDEEALLMSLESSDKTELIKNKKSVDWQNLKPLVEIKSSFIVDNDGNFIDDAFVDNDGLIYKKSSPDKFIKDAIELKDVAVFKDTNTRIFGIEIQTNAASFNVK